MIIDGDLKILLKMEILINLVKILSEVWVTNTKFPCKFFFHLVIIQGV